MKTGSLRLAIDLGTSKSKLILIQNLGAQKSAELKSSSKSSKANRIMRCS